MAVDVRLVETGWELSELGAKLSGELELCFLGAIFIQQTGKAFALIFPLHFNAYLLYCGKPGMLPHYTAFLVRFVDTCHGANAVLLGFTVSSTHVKHSQRMH